MVEDIMKALLVLSVLHSVESAFVDTYGWISIDCGAESYNLDTKNLINWEPDSEYIQTGSNKNVSIDASDVSEQMKTLRYFPGSGRNCYSFQIDGIGRYLVRARFYYGNHDDRMKPPVFDISVNELKWMTVVTSMSREPIVIEGIFRPATDVMRVCLVSLNNGDVPFISSLEVVQLPSNTYTMIELGSAFLLQERDAFGRTEDVVYTGNKDDDAFNRIWKAKGLLNYPNITTTFQFISYIENQPPNAVQIHAIEAPSLSDPIILSFNSTQTNQSLCVMLYFEELNNVRSLNDTRVFQIDIGNQRNMSLVELKHAEPQMITLYPEWVVGHTTISISAVHGSTLPPMINAMEMYRVMKMESVPLPASKASSITSHFLSVSFCCLINMAFALLPV